MGYQETTGTTSKKINLGFTTDKTVNQGRPQTTGCKGCRDQQNYTNPWGSMQGEGEAGRSNSSLLKWGLGGWWREQLSWGTKWVWKVFKKHLQSSLHATACCYQSAPLVSKLCLFLCLDFSCLIASLHHNNAISFSAPLDSWCSQSSMWGAMPLYFSPLSLVSFSDLFSWVRILFQKLYFLVSNVCHYYTKP